MATQRMSHTSTLARIAVVIVFALTASGCELVGGIFKAGIWVGALGVIAIGVLILVAMLKLKR